MYHSRNNILLELILPMIQDLQALTRLFKRGNVSSSFLNYNNGLQYITAETWHCDNLVHDIMTRDSDCQRVTRRIITCDRKG